MAQPKFIPKPGQIDYTNIRYAPTVNIVVEYKGKIFCVQRASDLRLYPNYWDWVCGFLDDNKSIEEKAYEELKEDAKYSEQERTQDSALRCRVQQDRSVVGDTREWCGEIR